MYDPFAADFNEIYGLYRFTLDGPNLRPLEADLGVRVTYYIKIYMRSHNQGTPSEYVEYELCTLDVDAVDGDPVHRSFTFRSFNDIERIEVFGEKELNG